jgi:hypothetical protein
MSTILAAVTLAIILGLILQGTFLHWILVLGLGVWVGVPVACVLAVLGLLARRRTGAVPLRLKTAFRIFGVTAGALVLSLGVGVGVHHWEIYRVRSFVDATVPKLERFRSWNGRYPAALEALGDIRGPSLLAVPGEYYSDGRSFRFSYWDPAGMMDGYYFDSVSRRWTYFD